MSRTPSRINPSLLITPISKFCKTFKLNTKLQITHLGPLVLFLIAYWIDHKLQETVVYPIYLIPILWLSSKWGWPIGVMFSIFAAFLSTPISPMLAWSSNAAYIDSFVTRSITLSFLAILYSNYTHAVAAHKNRYERLKSLVPQCPDCGAVLCRDGQWRSIEDLIKNPKIFGKLPTHNCHSLMSKSQP